MARWMFLPGTRVCLTNSCFGQLSTGPTCLVFVFFPHMPTLSPLVTTLAVSQHIHGVFGIWNPFFRILREAPCAHRRLKLLWGEVGTPVFHARAPADGPRREVSSRKLRKRDPPVQSEMDCIW